MILKQLGVTLIFKSFDLMRKMAGLILMVLFWCNVYATAIVIYITPDYVIMAADSKAVYTNAKTLKTTAAQVSKIYRSSGYYFALAGLIYNDAQAFNVGSIVDQQLRASSNPATAIESIKSVLKKTLENYLTYQKKHRPALFKKNVESWTYVTSLGIISIIDGKPYAHIIGFKIIDKEQVKIKTEEESFDIGSGRVALFYLGKTTAINRYMSQVQKVNEPPEQFVEHLIQLQIKSTPQWVGPPVDIIKLTPKEETWVKRKATTPVVLK